MLPKAGGHTVEQSPRVKPRSQSPKEVPQSLGAVFLPEHRLQLRTLEAVTLSSLVHCARLEKG